MSKFRSGAAPRSRTFTHSPDYPRLVPEQSSYAVIDQPEYQIKQRFMALKAQWKLAVRFESSTTAMAMHPAYQQIIGMGPAVLSLILHELMVEPDQWFWALRAITAENPVPDSAESFDDWSSAWLDWGKRNGHVIN